MSTGTLGLLITRTGRSWRAWQQASQCFQLLWEFKRGSWRERSEQARVKRRSRGPCSWYVNIWQLVVMLLVKKYSSIPRK